MFGLPIVVGLWVLALSELESAERVSKRSRDSLDANQQAAARLMLERNRLDLLVASTDAAGATERVRVSAASQPIAAVALEGGEFLRDLIGQTNGNHSSFFGS
jgi:hypothetical protein